MSVVFFFLVLSFFASILATWANIQNRKLYYVTKPIPLICLIFTILYSFQYFESITTVQILFLSGLVFGLLGDIFLLNSKYFIPGLISFLVGHIFYILYFFNFLGKINPIFASIFFSATLVYAIIFFIKMDNNKIRIFGAPVVVYMSAITFMVILAFNVTTINNYSIFLFPIGAILFYISDSILAYDKLISPNPVLGIPILTTYFFGQILLTIGVLLNSGIQLI